MVEIELRKLRNSNLYDAYKKPQFPPADNLQAVDDMINQLGTATNKSALRKSILDSLDEITETAKQNQDADALKTAAIYYGKIHEHGKADECEKLAKNFNGAAPSTTTNTVNFNGQNIPGTNLTWTLDANGTLTISGTDDMLHNRSLWLSRVEEN